MVLSLLLPTRASRLLPPSTQGCNRVRLMGDGKKGYPCSVIALHSQWGPRHGYEGTRGTSGWGKALAVPTPRRQYHGMCMFSKQLCGGLLPTLIQHRACSGTEVAVLGGCHLSWVGTAGLPWPLPIFNFNFLLGPANYVPSDLSISFCIKWFPYNSAFNYTASLRLLQEIINIVILLHSWMLDPDSFEVITKE